jgi:hypothetical protein
LLRAMHAREFTNTVIDCSYYIKRLSSVRQEVFTHRFVLSVDDEAGTADSLGKSDVVMNHRVT